MSQKGVCFAELDKDIYQFFNIPTFAQISKLCYEEEQN